jgi:hypothetical protein
MKLREEKGYTYGAGAGFELRRMAGPFTARAAVNTDATAPALADLVAELRRMREAAPADAELRAARDYLVGVFPLRFETPGPVVSAVGGLGPTAVLYRFSGAGRLAAAGTANTGGGPFALTLPARSATLAVIAPAGGSPPPTVLTFTATPQTLPAAGSSTLAWTTQNADTVTISGVAGSFGPNASTNVSVGATTTYQLTAAGPGGSANVQVTVTVQPAPPGGISFYTLTPCRIVDTRVATADGLHAPPLAPSPAVRTFSVPTNLCGVPSDARALSVNYTVVTPAASGDLKAWAATEAAQPLATVLSFRAGRTRANNGILRLSSDGTRSFDVLLVATQSADLVLDVNGFFR